MIRPYATWSTAATFPGITEYIPPGTGTPVLGDAEKGIQFKERR